MRNHFTLQHIVELENLLANRKSWRRGHEVAILQLKVCLFSLVNFSFLTFVLIQIFVRR